MAAVDILGDTIWTSPSLQSLDSASSSTSSGIHDGPNDSTGSMRPDAAEVAIRTVPDPCSGSGHDTARRGSQLKRLSLVPFTIARQSIEHDRSAPASSIASSQCQFGTYTPRTSTIDASVRSSPRPSHASPRYTSPITPRHARTRSSISYSPATSLSYHPAGQARPPGDDYRKGAGKAYEDVRDHAVAPRVDGLGLGDLNLLEGRDSMADKPARRRSMACTSEHKGVPEGKDTAGRPKGMTFTEQYVDSPLI